MSTTTPTDPGALDLLQVADRALKALEKATAAAQVERAKLVVEIADLTRRRDDEQQTFDKLAQLSNLQFIEKCRAAEIDIAATNKKIREL